MADNVVRTTQRSWADECALAEAASISGPTDTARAIAAIRFRQQDPRAYEFSNGRCFAAGAKASDDTEEAP